MTNRQIIERYINEINYSLGCYNNEIENVPKRELLKVFDYISEESTDVEVIINKENYIIEIKTVDKEKDFDILSKEEYISRYGEPEEE